jgi:hypothetical protein
MLLRSARRIIDGFRFSLRAGGIPSLLAVAWGRVGRRWSSVLLLSGCQQLFHILGHILHLFQVPSAFFGQVVGRSAAAGDISSMSEAWPVQILDGRT